MSKLRVAIEAAVAAGGLVVCLPLLAVASAAIVLETRGSPIFGQERVGMGGAKFTIFKLRTMTEAVGIVPGVTSSHDRRITRVGRLLRRYKIDELPQLLNVVRGEMGFVGPRPEVPQYVRHYSEDDRAVVLSVRPGITDPVTLSLVDEERLLGLHEDAEQYYVEHLLPEKVRGYRRYVRDRSWIGDLVIVVQTILQLLRKSATLSRRH